jgi:hypothetical protein
VIKSLIGDKLSFVFRLQITGKVPNFRAKFYASTIVPSWVYNRIIINIKHKPEKKVNATNITAALSGSLFILALPLYLKIQ